jgi:hypothetical protein
MADGHFPTLVSATRDANASTNPLFTRLTDGTTNVSLTGSSLNVNLTNASIVVTATDLDIRDLSHTQDSIKIGDGTDFLEVNADGSLNVNVTGGASNTQYAEDTAHVSGDIGTAALVVRKDTIGTNTSADGDYATLLQDANGRLYVQIHDGGNSITVDGTVAVSSVAGTVTVAATDLDIRDLNLTQDAVKVSGNSTANSATNPIFVKEVDAVVSNEVHSYNTASAVASDATSNHDYTVTGTTFLLKQIKFAASGGGKVEIQTGPVASLVSLCVGFIPKDGGIVQIDFNPPKEVPVTSTGTVRVIRTNRQGQAQDLYSTIIGNDIP